MSRPPNKRSHQMAAADIGQMTSNDTVEQLSNALYFTAHCSEVLCSTVFRLQTALRSPAQCSAVQCMQQKRFTLCTLPQCTVRAWNSFERNASKKDANTGLVKRKTEYSKVPNLCIVLMHCNVRWNAVHCIIICFDPNLDC